MRHPREGWKSRMSRRDFLRRSAGAAVALPGLSAILAACERPGAIEGEGGFQVARPDNPVTLPLNGEPIPDGLRPEKDAVLQIFNWDQYVWKRVVQEFVDEFGLAGFEITTFDNMDEAVAKMQTGQLQLDVFFPTYDVLGKLVAADLLQPLNQSYIPNLEANAWPVYQNPFYDQEWRYSVPYVVYTTGIGYRRDHISDETIQGMSNPYEILWDPQYSGKVGVYNSYRDAIAMALLKNGITDINTGNPESIEIAKNDLIAMIDLVNVRNSINGAYKKLPEGEYYLHQAWSGDMTAGWGYVPTYTVETYTTLGYWFPDDRVGVVDNDLIAIPRNAPHPVAAHYFLNYLLDFKHAMDNFSWVGYQPPQNRADPDTLTSAEGRYSKISNWAEPAQYVLPWMERAVVRKEDFDVGYRLAELSPQVDALWHDAWQEFKAGV